MSEDEAFVRSVVDSPGDDTPRLAYADWLADRGDPRADYLRAEFEWAKPWRAGDPPGWTPLAEALEAEYPFPPEWEQHEWPGLDAMLAKATGLDPLWVARVSRPPAGVCCDHLRFDESGPPLIAADIAAAEVRFGQTFPVPLAAFYLNYNGGRPDWSHLVRVVEDDDGTWMWDWVGVERFWPLPAASGERSGKTVDDLRDELRDDEVNWSGGWGEPDLVGRYIPLGKYDAGCGVFLMQPAGGSDEVFGLTIDRYGAPPPPMVPTLPQLLARIVTTQI